MKPIIKDIIAEFEKEAPRCLAEKWDNVGLQVGSLKNELTGIVTTLDITPEVIAYASEHGCNLIVSHHPLIFKGLKQLDTDSYQGKMIATLVQKNITVYSAHTNLDIADGGLNDWAAQRLGLSEVRGLVKTGERTYYKFVVFVPSTHASLVREALGKCGAGWIGNYSHCSYTVAGEGRFKPEEGTHPYIGSEKEIACVEEERIETIVDNTQLAQTIQTVRAVHPYEEMAYDVYALVEPKESYFLGRIGKLSKDFSSRETFLQQLQNAFPKAQFRFCGSPKSCIQTVAVCTGSAAEFMEAAAQQNADVYITGDVKYHEAQRAKELGLLVVDAGHFGTEEYVATMLQKRFAALYHEMESVEPLPIHAFEAQKDFFFSL